MAAKDPAEMMAAHDEEIISLLKAILAAQRDLLAAFGSLGTAVQAVEAAVHESATVDVGAVLAAADPRMARRMGRGRGRPEPPPPPPQVMLE